MASLHTYVTVTLLLSIFFCINPTVKCDDHDDDDHDHDEEDILLYGINSYRATLNLTALIENERAECLADKIADQFDNKPCTNTTGPYTVPGIEPPYANYQHLLRECHINVNTTRDGAILPVCVPHLDSTHVLSNYTRSWYASYVNDTKYTGIGIGSEDDWVVVVLTTNTPAGSFSP